MPDGRFPESFFVSAKKIFKIQFKSEWSGSRAKLVFFNHQLVCKCFLPFIPSLTQMDANISILQTQWNDDILGEECSHSPSVWLKSDLCFDSRAVQRKSWLFNLIPRMSKTQEHSYHWLAIIYCLSGPTKSSLKCPWSPVRATGEKNRSVLALEWKCSLFPEKRGKSLLKTNLVMCDESKFGFSHLWAT